MRDVAFVEVLAVVRSLEPELSQRFALGVRTYDAVGANEASEADTVEPLGVEYCRGVSYTLGKICCWVSIWFPVRLDLYVLDARSKAPIAGLVAKPRTPFPTPLKKP